MLNISLHPIEKRFLKALLSKDKAKLEDVAKEANLVIDQARRALEWLRNKGLVYVEEKRKRYYALGEEGKKVVEYGLPEARLARTLSDLGKSEINEIRTKLEMSEKEFNAAIGRAIRRKWVKLVRNDSLYLLPLLKPHETEEEKVIRKLSSGPLEERFLSEKELKIVRELMRRPNYINVIESSEIFVGIVDKWRSVIESMPIVEEVTQLRPEHLINNNWKKLKFAVIDISAPTPSIYPAKKHPLVEFIKIVREIFVSLGFEEVKGPLIQPAFWNFDALFTPQDHPARDMQDTFYLHGFTAKLPKSDLVERVKRVHENGGDTGSRGWGYEWSVDKAKLCVLRTHTTAVTIRALYELKGRDAKIFSIGRVFRNENVDAKHLAEFHQVEGIAVGRGLNLRHLMGYLTLFYRKLGFEKVKFWPTFFPYTEPSLQSMVYSEKLGKWLELCGMGIFRPEVVRPLGVDKPVLAWGMGLERLAMLYYDVADIRQFYINRLSWLREVRCR